MRDAVIRPIKPNEVPLLTNFLHEAIYPTGDKPKVSRTVLQNPLTWNYADNFGKQMEDVCRMTSAAAVCRAEGMTAIDTMYHFMLNYVLPYKPWHDACRPLPETVEFV